MMAPKVREEDGDRIVLAESVVDCVCSGLGSIFFALFSLGVASSILLKGVIPFLLGGGIHHITQLTPVGILLWIIIALGFLYGMLAFTLMGGIFLYFGLSGLLVTELFIIDEKIRNLIIMKESKIKYLQSIKKIPFYNLATVEITYNTDCKTSSYHSPSTSFGSNSSYDTSIITIYGDSVQIYHGNHKLKAEKIAGKICRITGKTITHRTKYTPPIVV